MRHKVRGRNECGGGAHGPAPQGDTHWCRACRSRELLPSGSEQRPREAATLPVNPSLRPSTSQISLNNDDDDDNGGSDDNKRKENGGPTEFFEEEVEDHSGILGLARTERYVFTVREAGARGVKGDKVEVEFKAYV